MASISSIMATQSTLFLCNPTTSLRRPAAYPLRSAHTQFRTPKPLFPSPRPKVKPLKSRISPAPNPILSGSTRTDPLGFAHRLAFPLKEPHLLHTAGPAFFAAARGVPPGSLHTPLTLVAAGMAKWLDMYSGVLTVRVLLSWFPNIPWNKQPFSAIRDVCDPYLNLFRNIIPPIFDMLDVSSLLAFAVLGALGSILNSSLQAY